MILVEVVVLVLADVGCAVSIVFKDAVCTIVVEGAEGAIVDAGVLLLRSPHMHIDNSILHLPVLLHLVLK